METTFTKKVKGLTMEQLFNGQLETIMVKYYENLTMTDDETFIESKVYNYRIMVRHPENSNGRDLFNAEIKRMKRPVKVPAIIIALLLVSINLFAQPSIGMKLLSNGVGMDLGFLIDNKVDVQLSTMGITGNNEKAKITTITAGYRVLLSRNELNNYSVTPSIGYGLYRVKDYTDYNNDPEGKAAVKQTNLNYPALNINIAKDIHKGQIYIQANYLKVLTYGVGFRVYFYRKLLIQN